MTLNVPGMTPAGGCCSCLGRGPYAGRGCCHLQVDDSRGAVTLHGVELQVSLEILGVQTGDGEAVAETSLREGETGGEGASGGLRLPSHVISRGTATGVNM